MMLYLNTKDIQTIGRDWKATVEVIEQAVKLMGKGEFHQPIKPYVNFPDPQNRIIAMPAYLGSDVNVAGIKWIASFPKNIDNGILRAHSVTIVNDAGTGKPLATINTALVSGIRTASVTGLIIHEATKVRDLKDLHVGIVGFGPIGQLHLDMLTHMFGDRIASVNLYDLRSIDGDMIPSAIRARVNIVSSWEEAYTDTDLFITCTVSSKGYINRKPKQGALLLNVSLRDFTPDILEHTQAIIVDDWEEVCRANTDIEVMHKERGLQKQDTHSIIQVVCDQVMQTYGLEETLFFNPMGMASFDLAIAAYYYRQALAKHIGLVLED